MAKSARCKKLWTIFLCSVFLFTLVPFSAYAQGLDPPEAGHNLCIYAPRMVTRQEVVGSTVYRYTDVEYDLVEYFTPLNGEDASEQTYICSIITEVTVENFRYTAQTTVLWNDIENQPENQQGYIYTTHDPLTTVNAITFGEGRTPIYLEEVEHTLQPNGDLHIVKRYDFQYGPVEGGKGHWKNIYLYVPEITIGEQENVQTDQEIIDNLLKEYAEKIDISDLQYSLDYFGTITEGIVNSVPQISTILVSSMALYTIAILLIGKR